MGYLAAKLGQEQPTQKQREQLVASIVKAILERSQPAKIYVFGSVLGDEFSYASDIDVAVVFADAAQLQRDRERLLAMPPLLAFPYDLLLYEQNEFAAKAAAGGICQVITENAKLAYDQRSKI